MQESAKNQFDDDEPTGAPADEKLLLEMYKYEDGRSYETEKFIYEITKSNFLVFGAVGLAAGGSNLLYMTVSTTGFKVFALLIVAVISLACSYMAVLWSWFVADQVLWAKCTQKALLRRKPMAYILWKYEKEWPKEFPDRAENLAELKVKKLSEFSLLNQIRRYLAENYVLKWVNLMPGAFAIIGVVYFLLAD